MLHDWRRQLFLRGVRIKGGTKTGEYRSTAVQNFAFFRPRRLSFRGKGGKTGRPTFKNWGHALF